MDTDLFPESAIAPEHLPQHHRVHRPGAPPMCESPLRHLSSAARAALHRVGRFRAASKVPPALSQSPPVPPPFLPGSPSLGDRAVHSTGAAPLDAARSCDA